MCYTHGVSSLSCGTKCWTFRIILYGYGSIPINTIFSGMNIHLPAILGFTRYQGFDQSPYIYRYLLCVLYTYINTVHLNTYKSIHPFIHVSTNPCMYPCIHPSIKYIYTIYLIYLTAMFVPPTPGQAHPHQHLGHVDFKLEPSVCHKTTRKCAPNDQYLFLVNIFVS